jgi:hypothetical protein
VAAGTRAWYEKHALLQTHLSFARAAGGGRFSQRAGRFTTGGGATARGEYQYVKLVAQWRLSELKQRHGGEKGGWR